MNRRNFLIALLVLPNSVTANPAVAGLAAIVVLLANAGDALSKITKGFRDLATAGSDAYSFSAAIRERDRLKILSKDLRELTNHYNSRVVDSIDDYIVMVRREKLDSEKKTRAWALVSSHIDRTLESVAGLLDDVKKEDGDFVLMPAYESLRATLNSRSVTLGRLRDITAPTSKEELVQLEQLSEKYKIFIVNAKEATNQLNEYIRTVGKSKV